MIWRKQKPKKKPPQYQCKFCSSKDGFEELDDGSYQCLGCRHKYNRLPVIHRRDASGIVCRECGAPMRVARTVRKDGGQVARRRECIHCGWKKTTYEK